LAPRGKSEAMVETIDKAGLKVAATLARFIEDDALPGTGIEAEAFWRGVAEIFGRFTPENRALLQTRDRLQARIDAWHEAQPGAPALLMSTRNCQSVIAARREAEALFGELPWKDEIQTEENPDVRASAFLEME